MRIHLKDWFGVSVVAHRARKRRPPPAFRKRANGRLLRLISKHDPERLAIRTTNLSPLDRDGHPVDDLFVVVAFAHIGIAPINDPNQKLELTILPYGA
ncbi:hypothetical protein [Paraburkholderia sp. UCT2]|uniref:hypothetical protein n=1 Tax=Paraburkholderia sp. UCT2 TaxID=2615208 RepID=UPI001655925A|nr:hypothetical protein [Paraburkholderia sp. UCT2]